MLFHVDFASKRVAVRAPARHALWAGQALSLRPGSAARLRVDSGRAWVTMGDGVDRFLSAGDALDLPAGAHVVVERWMPASTEALQFGWCPSPDVAAQRFAREMRQAARDLARSLSQAGTAIAALLRGLAGFSQAWVADRAAG